ncbi:MAG TPA: DUF4173 domain-containing protein [Gemmatimonadales bacterium]|nr:DUF4173 domain-containing protein [Gemmatimonadales bacterium]
MTAARRSLAALALGGGLGVAADLSRVWLPERLGTAVWLGLFLAALLVLLADDEEGVSLPLAAAAVGIGALVWRDSPALHALNLAVIGGCIVAGSRIGASLAQGAGGVVAWALAALEAVAHAALGAAAAVSEAAWSRLPAGRGLREASGIAMGLVFAAPVLAIFSALFAEADPLFESGLERAFTFDFGLDAVVPHAVVAGAVGWLSAGLLRGASMERRLRAVPAVPFAGSIRFATVGTALGGIAALFLIFVLLQTRYLFEGASVLAEPGGFSYADYARRGFFELVGVTALTLPVLLVADWALDQRSETVRARFRGLALLLLGLLGVIVLSALSRMALYAGMYGLTEPRVYVTAFMLLLCAVFACFTLTVLRGNRPAFMRGSLVATACAVGGLNLLAPDALIARVNLERGSSRVPVDVSYLASLSADAVPGLLERAGRLEHGSRCELMAELQDRWLDDGEGTWNLSRLRARRALEAYRLGTGRECAIEL